MSYLCEAFRLVPGIQEALHQVFHCCPCCYHCSHYQAFSGRYPVVLDSGQLPSMSPVCIFSCLTQPSPPARDPRKKDQSADT